jgi:hypothetical protein
MTGIPAEIWTTHLPNTNLERHRYAKPLGEETEEEKINEESEG